MDESKSNIVFITAPALSAICLTGYLLLEIIQFNVRILVVVFWLAVFSALISIFLKTTKQAYKYISIFSAPTLLFVPSSSIWAWTTWWVNGFV